jgi:hypothetical protein
MKKSNLAEMLHNEERKTKPHAVKAAPGTTTRNEDMKTVAGWFNKSVSHQLKVIGLENDGKTVQELMAEAFNLLFTKYGKPPIA